MLTAREQFKAEFLLKCASAGLTIEEMERVVDRELTKVAGVVGDLASGAGNALGGLGNVGLAAALLGPPALGAAAGLGLSKATDVDSTDIDTVKKRQLIDEYKRQVAYLKRKRGIV